MRRVAILLLLYVGVQLIEPLRTVARAVGDGGLLAPAGVAGRVAVDAGSASVALLAFGFLILAAYTVGELAGMANLPKITGYLFAGLIFGPSLLGVVPAAAVDALAPVNRLAIALIAFLAGAELQWRELAQRWRTVLGMLTAELALAFVLIVATLVALQQYVSFLRGGNLTEVVALSALFGAVAIVHSPAVTMALLSETGARGPVARTTLSIVLVADVVVVLLFSSALALTRALVPGHETSAGLSAGVVAWGIGGSVLVGAALGAGVALYMRFVQRELLLFAIVVAFLGAEIARIAHVEELLTLLVAGFVTENVTRYGGRELLAAMERSAAPVFVVFFALAGAYIRLDLLVALWPIALAVVLARALGIWGGSRAGAAWAMGRAAARSGRDPRDARREERGEPGHEVVPHDAADVAADVAARDAARDAGAASGANSAVAPDGRLVRDNVWLGLISQAGVAIGLTTIIASSYPERGEQMRTLLLSVIAINTVVGQILFRFALVRSGEVRDGREDAAATTRAGVARGAGVGGAVSGGEARHTN
ncbi:MAG TPA: cation:proton antiporter [Gemmatimonadaceae bacterium]|nr:cation:proton antiporter [Gemmatimonadaceae bacterium]